MLKLVILNTENYPLLCEMMDEWTLADEVIVPRAISKADYHNYYEYSEAIEVRTESSRLVPDSTFFCLDTERNIFVGAVNIRHRLNERLSVGVGHIGDGIRPSERKKGYGTKMVALALEECKKLNLDEVLMCCEKSNIASEKTIIRNGGILENEVEFEGKIMRRFLIRL
ncbi:MAG: GNAT family N-acetyltransferase [Ruminococcaceae bacterium]|nr:GNAT family N-acetyltransferase [Oscillospiraceae bacterium]